MSNIPAIGDLFVPCDPLRTLHTRRIASVDGGQHPEYEITADDGTRWLVRSTAIEGASSIRFAAVEPLPHLRIQS